jgi:hypothetical protein
MAPRQLASGADPLPDFPVNFSNLVSLPRPRQRYTAGRDQAPRAGQRRTALLAQGFAPAWEALASRNLRISSWISTPG